MHGDVVLRNVVEAFEDVDFAVVVWITCVVIME